ncbi:MAG TPA: RNA polymerase sigma factor [Candidatus Limnocylindria bacterium]|nr:RNA polymerase sigma factor [Candidatus Limnocylindria bacterium]
MVVGRARPADLTGGVTGTDEALVRAAKSGDASAFGELYERYRDPIYRYCLSRTGTSHDAEDLTSDVFVKALHSLDRYQERGLPFVAFLYRIARNAAIDRSRTLKQPLSVDELVTEPASRQNVEADATLAVDRSILLAALTKLKAEHRDVIVMRFIEGYSALEVAAALGKTEGAVRTLQHRALERLRKEFDDAEREMAKGPRS